MKGMVFIMKKEVIIIIEGVQVGSDEDAIITKAPGIYNFRNNKHFAYYEEKDNEGLLVTKNTLKFSSDQVDIIKRGNNNSHMVFRTGSITGTSYHTPYGMLDFQIQTISINVIESNEQIEINLKYLLLSENNIALDNIIKIFILPEETN